MKKVWLRATVALAAALLICMAVSCALGESFGVVSRTDTLNLRSQGSSSSQWLGSYSRGTWVEITGSQNNFYRVYTPDGRTGYMSKNYIDTGSGYSWIGVVDNTGGGAFLNFREQPSYNARVLDIFYNGVPLIINSYNNGWYCVTVNDQTGYVRSEFVTDHGSGYRGSGRVATIKTPNNTAMNLRSGPGMQYEVICQFPGDTYVMVLVEGDGWSRVMVEGYTGYMSNDFLQDGLCAVNDLVPGASVTTSGTPYAVVNNPKSTQALNLRRYASTASEVLGKLYNGSRLWVDEQGTEWCAVTDQFTGESGYVMTQFIQLYNLPSVPERRVVHPSGTYVNLRSAPDMTQSNIRARIPEGSYVTILSPGPDWCKVKVNGTTGYMMTYFLEP